MFLILVYFVHVSKHEGGAAPLRAGHRKREEVLKVITLEVSSCTLLCPAQTGKGGKTSDSPLPSFFPSIWQWEKKL